MNIKLHLTDDTMPLAQLDTLIKILAHQKATLSFLCDNKSKSIEEADALFAGAIAQTDIFYQEIYEHLFLKYSTVDPNDLLPK